MKGKEPEMPYIAIEEAISIPELAERQSSLWPPNRFSQPHLADWGHRLPDFTEYRLPEMDAAGIDIQVLSLTVPGLQADLGAPAARDVARFANDYLGTGRGRALGPVPRVRHAADTGPRGRATLDPQVPLQRLPSAYIGPNVVITTSGVFSPPRSPAPCWRSAPRPSRSPSATRTSPATKPWPGSSGPPSATPTGAANGGIASSGIFEARDVAGSLAYARSRPDTRDMTIGLFSRCLGCSSTFAAITQFPEAFVGVRCLVGPQPVTMKTIVARRLALLGVPGDRIDDLEQRIIVQTSIGFARRAPQEWARNVRVPAFLYQVHDDVLTEPSDVQTMFDNIPVNDKKLHWIRGTTLRWDGYLEFQRHPQPTLEWFAKHMS
jgi:hypothetical protein